VPLAVAAADQVGFDVRREAGAVTRREVDMRASPYDFAAWGFAPIRIETAEGKCEYAAWQRGFADRAAPLRDRLVDACAGLSS
jgi:hypothetical protein